MSEDRINLTSAAKVLRPYRRFEFDYNRVFYPGPPAPIAAQSAPGSCPIVFTWPANPNDVNPILGERDIFSLDEQARNATLGYSPRLISMVDVPFGSSVCFWLPVVPSSVWGDPMDPEGYPAQFNYAWRPIWRMRNMGDYRRKGKAWKIGQEAYGAADTNVTDGGNRVIIPASSESSLYVRTEPHVLSGQEYFGTQQAHFEAIVIPSTCARGPATFGGVIPQQPLLPQSVLANFDQRGQFQQGVIDPQAIVIGETNPAAPPLFVPYWTKAQGDEVALLCYKIAAVTRNDQPQLGFVNWDFGYDPATGFCNNNFYDRNFSIMFGVGTVDYNGPYPQMGPYIVYGQTGI
jgi:hypothetical protein